VRSRFTNSETEWTRAVTVVRVDAANPVIVIRDSFEGARAAARKVMTLNLMATGAVDTPAGAVQPPSRRHPVAEHNPDDPKHERPSVSPIAELSSGISRFGFTGRYGVDWDVYVVSDGRAEALLGNWSVTPWGLFITDREERQHILRVRASGA